MQSWPFLTLFLILIATTARSKEHQRIELYFGQEEEFRSQKMTETGRKRLFQVMKYDGNKKFLSNPLTVLPSKLFDNQQNTIEINNFKEYLARICQKNGLNHVPCRFEVPSYMHGTEESYLAFNDSSNHYLRPSGSDLVRIDFKKDSGVMEIVATPFKLKALDGAYGRVYAGVLQELKKQKWNPALFGGEGHVHIDLESAFKIAGQENKWDLRRFRNYLVSWMDHSELYWGVLHFDPKDQGAMPLMMGKDARDSTLVDLIKNLDQKIEEYGPEVSKDDFRRVYDRLAHASTPFSKNSAFNLAKDTIEIRTLRVKRNLAEMKRTYQLLESHLNSVAQVDGLLPFHGGFAPQNAQEAIDRFYLLVKDSGEDWSEMKKLMPAAWRLIPPHRYAKLADLYRSQSHDPGRTFRCKAWLFNHLLHF